MSEYTSLEVSKRLAEAGFKAEHEKNWYLNFPYKGDNGLYDVSYNPNIKQAPAYRSDTLLAWLLSHGDSIEITPDLDGFNCTFWKGHDDYNGISIFLPDALAELVLKVMEVSHV